MNSIKDDKVTSFMNFGKENKISRKDIILGVFSIVFVGFLVFVFGRNYIVVKSISIVIVAFCIAIAIYSNFKVYSNSNIKNLFLGVQSIGYSLLFFLLTVVALQLLLVGKTRIIITGLCISIYLLGGVLSIPLMKVWIQKDRYKKKNNRYLYGVVGCGAVGGMLIGRIFLGEITQEKAILILAFLSFVIALFFLLGTHNLYRYQLYRKFRVDEMR